MQLTVSKIKETISGVIGQEKYSVEFTAELYKDLLELEGAFSEAESMEDALAILESAKLLTARDSKTQVETACPALKLDPKSGKFFLHQNGVTSTIPVPQVLVDRIISSIEKEIPFEPLVRAWINFLRNPNFTLAKGELFAQYLTTTTVDRKEKQRLIDEDGYSEEKATELATYNDVSITKNGLLATYKYAVINQTKFDAATGEKVDRYASTYDEETGVKTVKLPENAEDYSLIPPIMGEGGDAFFAGEDLGHRIKVGAVIRLDSWSKVNCNDSTWACKGLHLGGLRYIDGYAGANRVLLNCFVNPMHIGAFDHSGNGAIRVLEYFVHSAVFAPNRALYNESNYAARTNAQWDEMRSEAITKSEEAIAKIKGAQAQLAAF